MEFSTEPISRRIAYIKRYKPKGEIATRLRLLKPVKGKLPKEIVEARAALEKARAALEKAWTAYEKAQTACKKARTAYEKALAAYNKVQAALEKALKKHKPAIKALHAKECPNCPWDGRTISQ